MEWLSKITDLVKLPTKHFALVAIVTGAILLLPEAVLKYFHLEAIPDPYGVIVGLIFLVSTGLVIVNVASWFISRFQTQRRITKRKEHIRTEVNRLDGAEQAILREFFLGGRSTITLPLDNPVVAGLIARGIISQVGQFGQHSHHGMMFSFRVSEAASEFITPAVVGLDEHLLDESDGNWTLNGAGIQWVRDNRPSFL